MGIEVVKPESLDEYLDRHGIKYLSADELVTMRRLGIKAPTPPASLWPNIIPTAKVFDMLREEMGHPLLIGNGYRPRDLNKRAGGAANSSHIPFKAVDADLPGDHDDRENQERFYEAAVRLWLKLKDDPEYNLRIGLYRHTRGKRVHLDTGVRKYRWQYRAWSKKYVKPIAEAMR